MKKIIIASHNPVKIRAIANGFERMFPEEEFNITPVSVPSGVSDQPMSNRETLQGAFNRAQNAKEQKPEADFWAGIEGGIEEDNGKMAAFAWIVIQSQSLCGEGRTGTFYLPNKVADLIREGKELGEADDIVFNQSNSKQNSGAIGLLTGDLINRTSLYEHGVVLALVPFKNKDLFA